MVSVAEVHAVPDRGSRGDRFFRRSWSALGRPDKAVTLIEARNAIEAAEAELGTKLVPGDIRRNIVTRGVAAASSFSTTSLTSAAWFCGACVSSSPACIWRSSSVFPVSLVLCCIAAASRPPILTEGIIRVGDSVSLGEITQASPTPSS